MRRLTRTILPAALLLALAAPAFAGAPASGLAGTPPSQLSGKKAMTRGVGSPPLSDADAARHVRHSLWEPRPVNRKANHRVPSLAELANFRANSNMPYKDQVTGNFKGTTDEIIQWAAWKHGINEDVLRGVAVVESWWVMSTNGDDGDSFGLMQLRRPYHCCLPIMASSTAFNVDYYAAIIRAYYDGKQTWLNTVERGQPYVAGDLWGSIAAWYSGRWRIARNDPYMNKVQQTLRERTWLNPLFKNY